MSHGSPAEGTVGEGSCVPCGVLVTQTSCLVAVTLDGETMSPAPLVKEIVSNPLYIVASFVEDKVSMGVWILKHTSKQLTGKDCNSQTFKIR